MSVDSVHPDYSARQQDWRLMADSYAGERTIKEQAELYLPPTPGQLLRGMAANGDGRKLYDGYKQRSVYPDFVAQAVEALLGVMHHKEPVIEVPDRMLPMLDNMTPRGETASMLLRRINQNQITFGRAGLLLDVPDGQTAAEALPYVSLYSALNITNWDDGARDEITKQTLNFVALNESEYERERDRSFEWVFRKKYRVLILGDPNTNENVGEYRVGVFREEGSTAGSNENRSGSTASFQFDESVLVTPSLAGRTLNQVPFVFVNSSDIVSCPDDPPLLGLANLALTVYRGEADYRQALFMQGQDTLVVIGGSPDTDYVVGAGSVIQIPALPGADVKYAGVESEGLPEMREALQNDRKEAADMSGRLLDNNSETADSGKALSIRVSARTASVKQIALTGGAALERILKIAAVWLGIPQEQIDEIKVRPNTDFTDEQITGKDLLDFTQAKNQGMRLSWRTIHNLAREKGVTDMDFEEEEEEIENETPEPTGNGIEDDALAVDVEEEESEDT